MSDPQDIKVLTFKRDAILIAVHFALCTLVVVAMLTHFRGLDIGTGVVILGALQVPGLIGVKTMPGVVAALITEVQRQLAHVASPEATTTTTKTTPDETTTTTTTVAATEAPPTTPDLPNPASLPPPPFPPKV